MAKQKEIKGYLSDVEKELKLIAEKSIADTSDEIDAIGDALERIEDCFKDLDQELEEVKEEKKSLKERVEELTEHSHIINEVDTSLGTLKYEVTNLMDEQIMEAFVECLKEVNPATMLENLKTILKYKTVW